MLFADLSRSSEKDRLAVLYHRKKALQKLSAGPLTASGVATPSPEELALDPSTIKSVSKNNYGSEIE